MLLWMGTGVEWAALRSQSLHYSFMGKVEIEFELSLPSSFGKGGKYVTQLQSVKIESDLLSCFVYTCDFVVWFK